MSTWKCFIQYGTIGKWTLFLILWFLDIKFGSWSFHELIKIRIVFYNLRRIDVVCLLTNDDLLIKIRLTNFAHVVKFRSVFLRSYFMIAGFSKMELLQPHFIYLLVIWKSSIVFFYLDMHLLTSIILNIFLHFLRTYLWLAAVGLLIEVCTYFWWSYLHMDSLNISWLVLVCWIILMISFILFC